jgi:hypothetical protein
MSGADLQLCGFEFEGCKELASSECLMVSFRKQKDD